MGLPDMSGSTTFRLALPPLALLTVLVAAFCMGKFAIAPADLLDSLFHTGEARGDVDVVLWQVRLPRILAGVFVGASLSAAGAAYQGMFRNPLVSPDVLTIGNYRPASPITSAKPPASAWPATPLA